MKTSRWLAFALMASVLLLPTLASAQEATPSDQPAGRQVLYEMNLSPADMPKKLAKIGFDRVTIAPGFDVTFDKYAEGIRGRGSYVESGELLVYPLAPSPVWRGNDEIGTAAVIFQPGEEIRLTPGDSMLIPAMLTTEFGPDEGIRMANPGTVDAVHVGFHLHQAGGTFFSPPGYSYTHGQEYYGVDGLAQVSADDTVFRLTRITAEPGTILPLTDGTVVTFYQINAGELTYTKTGASTSDQLWEAGRSGKVEQDPAFTHEVRVTGDSQVEVLELAVIPSAPASE